jgi:hypothetical protein
MKTWGSILVAATFLVAATADAKEVFLPFVHHTYAADYGDGQSVTLNWQTGDTLTITHKDGADKGKAQTVQYSHRQVRPDVFILTWREEDHSTTLLVNDYRQMRSHLTVIAPDGALTEKSARMKLLN